MRSIETDVAVIGAGSAGLQASREVQRAGKRWLLIESGPYGTLCARSGCMPSKLLIAAADTARRVRRASLFGVNVAPEQIRIDRRAVMDRVRRERDRFVELNARETEALPADNRLHGTARFIGPGELDVDGTRVKAKAIVIATGSTPVVPKELSRLGDALLTSDSLFDLEELPESMAVFGTGAIGLELGQALHQLGVRVTFYNPFDQLGPFTDPEIARRFRKVLAAEHDLALGAEITDVRVDANGVVLRHRESTGGRQQERRFARVLAAVGRKPALDKLDLAKAGIELDEKGVPTCDPHTMRCGDSNIFMAGDCDGERPVLHEAVDDGALAGANAAGFPDVQPHTRRTALNIGFTHPQLAMVGKTFKALEHQPFAVGEVSYEDQGRARVIGQNRGHLRVYADYESGKLIGAELFGPAAEHTAHLLAWSVQQELTIGDLLRLPYYHPTLEEGLRTALRDVAKRLTQKASDDCEVTSEFPGA
ncbi:MAG: dihydrolipoyl dehydrogenase [Polyangiales bacterium]